MIRDFNETRMGTPDKMSFDIPQSKYCFRTLHLNIREATIMLRTAQKCLKTISFIIRQTFKTIEYYFQGLELQYGTPEMGFPSCEI